MTGAHVPSRELNIALAEAESLQDALERSLSNAPVQAKEQLVSAAETLADACWIARWLGEQPRVELTAAQVTCLLSAVPVASTHDPLVMVREQLEALARLAPSNDNAVAV